MCTTSVFFVLGHEYEDSALCINIYSASVLGSTEYLKCTCLLCVGVILGKSHIVTEFAYNECTFAVVI